MTIGLLYYPSISLPDITWLRNVILYVDKIASIVPYDREYDIRSHADTSLLMETQHYEPLAPERFFDTFGSIKTEFEAEVQKVLQSRSRKSRRVVGTTGRVSQHLIHNSKFSFQIEQFMRTHKLLDDVDGVWRGVSTEVAELYMNLLAKYMGLAYNYVPSTDQMKAERQAFGLWGKEFGYQVGFVELLRCLPVPDASTSLERILDLKDRRSRELHRFQNKLMEYQLKIASVTSFDELNYYKNLISNEIQMGVDEIHEFFGESRINGVLTSFRSLFEFKNPNLITSEIAGLATYATTHHWQTSLVAASLNAGTVYVASRMALKKELRGNPFSYLFHANRQVGLTWENYHQERT